MVITRIIGGLGNQMFQYAAGKSLAHRIGKELKLDISSYQEYNLRKFELDCFNITYKLALARDVLAYTGETHPFWGRFSRSLYKKGIFTNSLHYRERTFHYDTKFLQLKRSAYLAGYWQSERYFLNISDAIRSEFIFSKPMSNENVEVAKEIQATNAVSLHVRRGDYANNSSTRKMHGLCSPAYYESAMHYISRFVESPHYFIFSDDTEWVNANLLIASPHTCIDHNHEAETYNDMRLMSLCSHHIIANSSFSWWGAWLNPSHDKIVVAPSRWFNSTIHDTRDLYCPNWVVL